MVCENGLNGEDENNQLACVPRELNQKKTDWDKAGFMKLIISLARTALGQIYIVISMIK